MPSALLRTGPGVNLAHFALPLIFDKRSVILFPLEIRDTVSSPGAQRLDMVFHPPRTRSCCLASTGTRMQPLELAQHRRAAMPRRACNTVQRQPKAETHEKPYSLNHALVLPRSSVSHCTAHAAYGFFPPVPPASAAGAALGRLPVRCAENHDRANW